MTARQGFGVALLGAVLWAIVAVVAALGGAGSGLIPDAVLALLGLCGIVLLVGGLAVAAVSLIRGR